MSLTLAGWYIATTTVICVYVTLLVLACLGCWHTCIVENACALITVWFILHFFCNSVGATECFFSYVDHLAVFAKKNKKIALQHLKRKWGFKSRKGEKKDREKDRSPQLYSAVCQCENFMQLHTVFLLYPYSFCK